MSAMIDVVFLLLVYFVLTKKPDIPEVHMAINLPSPNPATQPDEPPPTTLEIHVLAGERYMLQGTKQVSLQALENYLLDFAAFGTDQTVMIKVEPEAREAALVNVLDRCSKANLSNLNVLSLN